MVYETRYSLLLAERSVYGPLTQLGERKLGLSAKFNPLRQRHIAYDTATHGLLFLSDI